MSEDEGLRIWQIGAGTWDRSYADVFLKYSVALIGPGDTEEWSKDRDDEEFGGGFVRRFASEVGMGDVLVLRHGASSIRAIGLVASEYIYLPQFGDVNGWDLQHARRVRWQALPEEYDFDDLVFGPRPSRLSRSWDAEVRDYVERFLNSPPTGWQKAELPSLPEEEPDLTDVPHELLELIGTVRDMYELYWDVKRFGDRPSEHEGKKSKCEQWLDDADFHETKKGVRSGLQFYVYPDGHGNIQHIDSEGKVRQENQPVSDMDEAVRVFRDLWQRGMQAKTDGGR